MSAWNHFQRLTVSTSNRTSRLDPMVANQPWIKRASYEANAVRVITSPALNPPQIPPQGSVNSFEKTLINRATVCGAHQKRIWHNECNHKLLISLTRNHGARARKFNPLTTVSVISHPRSLAVRRGRTHANFATFQLLCYDDGRKRKSIAREQFLIKFSLAEFEYHRNFETQLGWPWCDELV